MRLGIESNGTQRAQFGHTVNLSAGGMLVESSSGMAMGDCIDLRFHLPGDPNPVAVMARVVRAPAPGAAVGQWGLSFERLDDGDRKRLNAFVSSSSGGFVGWTGAAGSP